MVVSLARCKNVKMVPFDVVTNHSTYICFPPVGFSGNSVVNKLYVMLLLRYDASYFNNNNNNTNNTNTANNTNNTNN